VKTSEYLDMIAADAKEQPIGETAEAGPARLALDDRKLERVLGEPDVQGLELGSKPNQPLDRNCQIMILGEPG
jgi:hypothetical protein